MPNGWRFPRKAASRRLAPLLVGNVAKDYAQKHRDRLNRDLAARDRIPAPRFLLRTEGTRRSEIGLEQAPARRPSFCGTRDHPHPRLATSVGSSISKCRANGSARTRFIGVGPVEFLAHVLVRPAASDEQSLRYDAEVERVAMQLVVAYERAHGARVDMTFTLRSWLLGPASTRRVPGSMHFHFVPMGPGVASRSRDALGKATSTSARMNGPQRPIAAKNTGSTRLLNAPLHLPGSSQCRTRSENWWRSHRLRVAAEMIIAAGEHLA